MLQSVLSQNFPEGPKKAPLLRVKAAKLKAEKEYLTQVRPYASLVLCGVACVADCDYHPFLSSSLLLGMAFPWIEGSVSSLKALGSRGM